MPEVEVRELAEVAQGAGEVAGALLPQAVVAAARGGFGARMAVLSSPPRSRGRKLSSSVPQYLQETEVLQVFELGEESSEYLDSAHLQLASPGN